MLNWLRKFLGNTDPINFLYFLLGLSYLMFFIYYVDKYLKHPNEEGFDWNIVFVIVYLIIGLTYIVIIYFHIRHKAHLEGIISKNTREIFKIEKRIHFSPKKIHKKF